MNPVSLKLNQRLSVESEVFGRLQWSVAGERIYLINYDNHYLAFYDLDEDTLSVLNKYKHERGMGIYFNATLGAMSIQR